MSRLSKLIENKVAKYKDTEMISLLGMSGSGKTIVTALFGYTLNKSFIPKSAGKWEAVYSSGYDEINEIIRDLKEGIFTESTLEHKFPNLAISIYSMEGIPTEFVLHFRDISGENFANLLGTDNSDIDKRLMGILRGAGAYILFAKKYVIMIDCDKTSEWDSDGATVNSMLSSLRKLKNKIHNLDEKTRIDSPIAIVFSKADLLPKKLQEKSANELSELYVGLRSSLRINAKEENVAFFKLSIKSSKKNKKEYKTQIEQKIESEKKKTAKQIQTSIDVAVKSALQNTQNDDLEEEERQKIIDDTKSTIYEEYTYQSEERIMQLRESIDTQLWNVDKPLSYTEPEYNKLISWILDEKDSV